MNFGPVSSGPITPLVGIAGMPYGGDRDGRRGDLLKRRRELLKRNERAKAWPDGGGYGDMSWQEPPSVNGAVIPR